MEDTSHGVTPPVVASSKNESDTRPDPYFPIKILYSYDEKIRQFEVTPQEGQSWTTTSVEDLTNAVASRLCHDDVEPLRWVLAYPFQTEINGVSHSRIEWIANHLELDSLYCLESQDHCSYAEPIILESANQLLSGSVESAFIPRWTTPDAPYCLEFSRSPEKADRAAVNRFVETYKGKQVWLMKRDRVEALMYPLPGDPTELYVRPAVVVQLVLVESKRHSPQTWITVPEGIPINVRLLKFKIFSHTKILPISYDVVLLRDDLRKIYENVEDDATVTFIENQRIYLWSRIQGEKAESVDTKESNGIAAGTIAAAPTAIINSDVRDAEIDTPSATLNDGVGTVVVPPQLPPEEMELEQEIVSGSEEGEEDEYTSDEERNAKRKRSKKVGGLVVRPTKKPKAREDHIDAQPSKIVSSMIDDAGKHWYRFEWVFGDDHRHCSYSWEIESVVAERGYDFMVTEYKNLLQQDPSQFRQTVELSDDDEDEWKDKKQHEPTPTKPALSRIASQRREAIMVVDIQDDSVIETDGDVIVLENDN